MRIFLENYGTYTYFNFATMDKLTGASETGSQINQKSGNIISNIMNINAAADF